MDMLPSTTEYRETWLSGFPFFHQAGHFVCSCAMTWAATQILIPDPRNVQLIDRAAAYRLSNIQPIDIETTERHLRDGGATCKGQNSRKKATG